MKVLLINGSARQRGNTYTARNQVAEQLKKNGVDSEIVWIGHKPIRGCIACNTCKTKGNCRCAFEEDICNDVIAKMMDCDGLVVGSPVYWGQPNGAVLSLIQRMAYSAGGYMSGKPAAAVCVCRRGGATAAFQALQMPFQMLNMPIVTSQYWNIAYGRTEGESAQDDEGMQTMRTLANNMSYMLKKFATGTAEVESKEPWLPTNFIR